MGLRIRIWTLILIFAAVSAAVASISRAESRVPRVALRQLPYQLGQWNGRDTADFDAKTLRVLGVDDYVTRWYSRSSGPAVSVYIGYYATQRTGDTMHSPMRCLPGSGWQPLATGRATIAVSPELGSVTVNRYLVQKGLQRHVVLFWYQVHGRVLASEYATKAYIVTDAVRLNRTDAALVRIIVPVPENTADAETVADRAAADFVRTVYPRLLATHLPA